MKTALRLFVPPLLLTLAGAATQSDTIAPPPGLPPAEGVYYQASPSRWVKLEPARAEESTIRNREIFLETAGLLALNMTFTYPGSRASLQISEPRPTFYVRGTGSAGDALIVRLTKKKQGRTAEASSADAGIGNKTGFKREHVRPVGTVAIAEGLFSVRPEDSLEPGEYLLVFDSPSAAYDFGIGPTRR